MNEIYFLTQEERELFFQTAADIQNMPFEIIEKDFWVVWILGRLFSLEKVRPYLTFKRFAIECQVVYGLLCAPKRKREKHFIIEAQQELRRFKEKFTSLLV